MGACCRRWTERFCAGGSNDVNSALFRTATASDEFPFVKMHGLRNCFVILDLRDCLWTISASDAIRICDMRAGVGGEQLVTIEQPSKNGVSAGAAAFMRIYNIDGQEVSACGNATRCVAHLLMEQSGLAALRIETAAGVLHCRRSGELQVSVDLGPFRTGWQDIPLADPVDTHCLPVASGPLRDGVAVNIGNPHAIFFVDRLDSVHVSAFAPVIQNHALFPQGANVGVAEVVDHETIRLAVWERPGMLTEACGTGACAAAFAARRRGLVATDRVTVYLPAGPVLIELSGDMVTMTGPVATCCCGFVPVSRAGRTERSGTIRPTREERR